MLEKLLDLYDRLSKREKTALLGAAVLAVVAALAYALQFGLSDIKDAAEALSAFFTAIAFVVGGIWAYMLFVRQRQRYPRATLEQRVVHKRVDERRVLLRVSVTVSNQGDVLLSLASGFVRVQQMVPWPSEFVDAIEKGEDPVRAGETEVEWPLLGERYLTFEESEREVEPGEPDEFHFDFVIGGGVQTVLVYTYISNQHKRGRDIGWGVTTVYDLDG